MSGKRPTRATVTVVIPTYGGGARLLATLRSVMASETTGLERLEIVVVDDGSPEPVSPLVEECCRSAEVRVSTIRQDNSGPAKARNRGFRVAQGDLILFLDDDIDVPPDLVLRHVSAHQRWPGSVVWGRCVLPSQQSPMRDVLQAMGGDDHAVTEEFVHVGQVSSGQLSMERRLFASRGFVYAETLRTPAAEEYELALRLRRQGIPIVFAPRIVALHCQSLEIAAVCKQQYKHGVGCAEAACRCPATLELTELSCIIERATARASTLKALARVLVSGRAGRRILLTSARLLERIPVSRVLLKRLYWAAIAAHFVGGVRDGLKRFGVEPPE